MSSAGALIRDTIHYQLKSSTIKCLPFKQVINPKVVKYLPSYSSFTGWKEPISFTSDGTVAFRATVLRAHSLQRLVYARGAESSDGPLTESLGYK